jgi:hypothetical protein
MIDLEKVSEGIHYELIPADDDVWHVRITEEYPETVIRFGAVEFVGDDEGDPNGYLRFNFDIVSTPDDTLTDEDLTFQEYCGMILQSILEESIHDGTVGFQDVNTGEVSYRDSDELTEILDIIDTNEY